MAKIITLSNGERVLVSDHRYEFLSRWTWHFVNGYAGAVSERQPAMYFPSGGSTLRGGSKKR